MGEKKTKTKIYLARWSRSVLFEKRHIDKLDMMWWIWHFTSVVFHFKKQTTTTKNTLHNRESNIRIILTEKHFTKSLTSIYHIVKVIKRNESLINCQSLEWMKRHNDQRKCAILKQKNASGGGGVEPKEIWINYES